MGFCWPNAASGQQIDNAINATDIFIEFPPDHGVSKQSIRGAIRSCNRAPINRFGQSDFAGEEEFAENAAKAR
jgi:hypothetical protein